MKNDINLLYKRKVKKPNGKKVLTAFLGIIVLAGGLYAGITFPTAALEAEKNSVAKLDEELSASTDTADLMLEKSDRINYLEKQLEGLNRLNIQKSDVSDYIDIIETSLPQNANIVELSLMSDELNITGVADNDTTIATFSLRLRETNVFKDVFVYTSQLNTEDGQSSVFTLTAMLQTSLSTSTVSLMEQESLVQEAPALTGSQIQEVQQ